MNQMLEVAALAKAAQMSMSTLTNPHGNVSLQATKETKKVQVDETFPERAVTIGAGLTDK